MKTVALNGRDIDRVLIWAGATLQAPHRAMAAQRGIAPYGVFVSFFFYGSPATHYGLYAGRRITEVDGQPTPDLDAFLKAVRGKPDRASLRLKTISWNGMTDVITLKLDKHYWPAYELDRQSDGSWRRTDLDAEVAMARAPSSGRSHELHDLGGCAGPAARDPARSITRSSATRRRCISDVEVTLANREAWLDAKRTAAFRCLWRSMLRVSSDSAPSATSAPGRAIVTASSTACMCAPITGAAVSGGRWCSPCCRGGKPAEST